MFQETAELGYKMPPARRLEGSLCAVEGHSGPDRVPDRALRDSVQLRVSRQVRTLTVPKPEPKPPGFDRKAYNREYNREYMRKRRAAAKAERNAQRSVNPQSDPKADTSGNP